MTPFASVALYRRDGKIVFKPPRKERPDNITQARKAAARHWRSLASNGDVLVKVIVLREFLGKLQISERGHNSGHDNPWVSYEAEPFAAAKEPHLAACMAELGIDATAAPPAVPDVLVINGFTYRRDI